MANFLYDSAVDGTFAGLIDWTAGTNFRIIGLTSGYTPSAAHQFLSSVPGGAVRVTAGIAVATPVSFTGRKFKFPVTLFPAVTNGAVITYVLLYIHTGTDATSKLLYLCDTAATLPITGTGADDSFTPDGTTGLFSL